MSKQVSYSYARQNLAELLNETEDTQEPVIITRRNHEDVAMIPAAEFRSLEETAHLLRSPENARRLLAALQRALGNERPPATMKQLKDEFDLP